MSLVSISDSAVTYLQDLLNSQEEETNIKIFVSDPGTMRAETCIVYCKVGEEEEDDVLMEVGELSVYLENESLSFLEDCKVDYHPDKFGGQLTIKAPSSRVPNIGENATLEDKVNYILYDEINPQLASHGGNVHLDCITDDNYVVLQFGGGCQGCGMVDVTLKEGIEKTLLEKLPDLKGVKDITDHTENENAYYK